MNKKDYLALAEQVIQNGLFQDNWDSMWNIPIPEWYQQSKFGIFIHWGLYAVPAYLEEWYPRNMYIQGSKEYEHHIATYGPHTKFGYKDFIPLFKGESFDADAWMDTIVQSGAKYVVMVAEHHDGFQMYKSDLSHFNASEMGPKRDVLMEVKLAAEKRGIHFGLSSHRIEHWFFMGHGKEFDSDIKEPLREGDFYWPAQPEPKLDDLSSTVPSTTFMEDWLVRCCELVEQYQPEIFFFDWWIQIAAAKPYLKKFAAFYYNRAKKWGKDGIINYKYDAFPYGCAVLDLERGQFSDIRPRFWQTDTAIARNSWCYTETNHNKDVSEIICDLCDITSKNGALLLNIGPMANGLLSSAEVAILNQIGKWLEINGEAIYGTTYFRSWGEGPTIVRDGQFTDGAEKSFTHQDIRFTQRGSTLYAIILKYPADGKVAIHTLGIKTPHFHGIIKRVQILGFAERPRYQRTKEALFIETSSVSSKLPVVIKIGVD